MPRRDVDVKSRIAQQGEAVEHPAGPDRHQAHPDAGPRVLRQVCAGGRAFGLSVRELAGGAPLDDQEEQEERDRIYHRIVHQRGQHIRKSLCQIHGDTSPASLAGGYRKLSTSLPQAERMCRSMSLATVSCRSITRQARSASWYGSHSGWPSSPSGLPWIAKLRQRAWMRADTALPVLIPPSLNVGSFGPATRLPHTNGSSVACAP